MIMSIELLRDREYLTALTADLETAQEIAIECLSISPALLSLLSAYLARGGKAEVLCNAPQKTYLHSPEFLQNRKKLRAQGAQVYSYNAPHINHCKLVLIAPDIVYLGSHNMTHQSLHSNRENSLRLIHPEIYNKLRVLFNFKTRGK